MRALLEHGADVNSGPLSSCTALSFAITNNAGDSIVKALLDHRANPNSTDTDGHTPLHHAITQGSSSLVEALLNKGANIDALYHDITPLSWAVIVPAAGESIVKLLLTQGANIHIKDSHDKTPLHHAAQKGLRTIVKLLIDKGADVHAKDRIGFTYDQYLQRSGANEIPVSQKLFY
jgi:ankyrin repeat protein